MELKFTDLHDKLTQYKMCLISKEDLIEWLNINLELKNYIPIVTKYAMISVFVDKLNFDIKDYLEKEDGLDYIYMTYDINLLFDLLFKYTNVTVISKYRTVENYDLIIETGLYDYITSKCGSDYNIMIQNCNRVSGINNIHIVKQMVNIFGNPPSAEDIEKIKDLVNNEIDPEKLNIIKAIEEYNNPIIRKVFEKASVETIKESIKK